MIADLKKTALGIRWIRRLVAAIRSAQTKRRYARILSCYSSKDIPGSCEALLERRAGKRLARLRRKTGNLNILYLGTDELQDRSGIVQGLEEVGFVTCFTRSDGAYGQNYPGTPVERRKANTERLRELFARFSREGSVPDLLIGQTWGDYVDGKLLSEIKSEHGTVIVNIAMDDRHRYWGDGSVGLWGGTRGLVDHIDLGATAAPECVEWYLKEGCPAVYFPEGSDARLFRPLPDVAKTHDISFVGARYGLREEIVLALRNSGIGVECYGTGWERGRIAVEDVPVLFARSRIVLGVGTIGHCRDFYALKMRDFDAPMSGSVYLTHDNPDLYDLFAVGQEIETYRDAESCVSKAGELLADPERCERMRKAARGRAEREHTWGYRFRTLLTRSLGIVG